MQQTGIQCYNHKEFGHVARKCKKPKRARNLAYHKEKMLMCKQEEAGIQLSTEQIQEVTPDAADNSELIFDVEPLQKQPESFNDTYLVEQGDTNITSDSSDMSNNGEEDDQDDQMLQKERELLASLIEQMKIEIDGSKQTNKSLESSNKALREANMFLNFELKRYQNTDFVKNTREKCAKAYGLLEEQKVKTEKSFSADTEKILGLNKRISEMENEMSAHK
ncbi:hypothetical protein Tco_0600843 [Tanacetum coccineum]